MKTKAFFSACLLAMVCTSCWTRIVTVSPSTQTVIKTQPVTTTPVYTTTTTVRPGGNSHVTVTTSHVSSAYTDWSFALDLQAVAAAFCEARNVEEFEMILNSKAYMISNLDLNADGWVDYLRVLEVLKGNTHVLVIQSCLGYNKFQDVATLVAECSGYVNYVQVIGDPYIYGNRYIVQPVILRNPPMYAHYHGKTYTCWHSPYCWGHFPTHYVHPAPVQYAHYHAYVSNYMKHHKYCNEVQYPQQVHYTQYETVRHPISQRDYQSAHPEQSFSSRNANVTYAPSSTSSVRTPVTNAADLRRVTQTDETTTTSRGNSTSTTTRPSASTTTRPVSSTSTTTSGSRPASSSTTTRKPDTKQESVTTTTRVNTSGTVNTTIKITTSSGTTTVRRGTSSTTRTSGSSTSTRTSSSTSTRSSSTSTGASSTRTSTRSESAPRR